MYLHFEKNMMTLSDTYTMPGKLDSGDLSDRQISQLVYVIRCIAILAVVAAHVNIMDNSNYLSSLITHVWAVFAQFGVPAFFIIGGYYYHRDENDSKIFWQKKLHSVIIPWVIASIVTYFGAVVCGDPLTVVGYFKWFIGLGSIHYYMTIYLSMLVIFKFVRKTPYLLTLIVIMFGSLFLEQVHFWGDYGGFGMTKYLNIFNWAGYFAFGVLIKKYRMEKKVNNWVMIASFVAFLFFIVVRYHLNKLSYFTLLTPFTQVSFLILIYGLIKDVLKLKFMQRRIVAFVGCNSLIIYLYHIQIVPFLLNRLPRFWLTQLIKPFLGLIIMVLLVYVASAFLQRYSWGCNIMKCVGLKNPVFEKKL